jgi:ribosomal protein S17E
MGRIKTKPIKRAGTELVTAVPELFNSEFNHNKKVLGRDMPSKKVRNMIAGFITRYKRNTKKIIQDE